ncbi:unnamed protein product, partial [Strongylus vulgaris]
RVVPGFVSSFYQILIALACIGGLQGASWVPATKLVAKWYTDGTYGKMFSILGCGSTVAGLFIPLLVGAYWRVIMLVYSAFVFFWLQNDDVKPSSPSTKEDAANLTSLIWSPVIWSVGMIYLFSMEVRTVCETWIPLHINENGMSPATFQVLYEIGG